MSKYINDPGNEVPDNKILFINKNRHSFQKHNISEIIEPLVGNSKRDWFNENFYRCLPLTIANQYGFLLKSANTFILHWDGKPESEVQIKNENGEPRPTEPMEEPQTYFTNFQNGILSIVNYCVLRTPPKINIMTMQPPNMINNPDIFVMNGVVETDNLRPFFTFNLKVLTPNKDILIKKGDPIAAFIPIQRYFVENFSLENAEDYFDKETIESEQNDIEFHLWERQVLDPATKKYGSGRRYYQGINGDGSKFPDHQKNFRKSINIETQSE